MQSKAPIPVTEYSVFFHVSPVHPILFLPSLRQELCIRKEIKVGDKIFYKDTNNSAEDMQDVNERNAAGLTQTAFPIGWRKK